LNNSNTKLPPFAVLQVYNNINYYNILRQPKTEFKICAYFFKLLQILVTEYECNCRVMTV